MGTCNWSEEALQFIAARPGEQVKPQCACPAAGVKPILPYTPIERRFSSIGFICRHVPPRPLSIAAAAAAADKRCALGFHMRGKRVDLSDRVTHLIRNKNGEETAADTLHKIATDQYLKSTNTAVIGGDSVVCFSEAPLSEFTKESAHFQPFGISIKKSHLFSLGGRPVIYQPKEEHKYIDSSIIWKVVSYNPTEEDWIDWSWQREWRIKTDALFLAPEQAIFIVPTEEHREILISRYRAHEENRALCEELMLGLYPQSPELFPYEIQVACFSSN
jgi:hypothetical protein